MLKVNSRNTRTRWEICSKLTLKTHQNDASSGVFIVNFEHISHLAWLCSELEVWMVVLLKIGVLIITRKSLKNSSREVHFFSKAAGFWPAALLKMSFFNDIFQCFHYFLGDLWWFCSHLQNNKSSEHLWMSVTCQDMIFNYIYFLR